ncbi:MAG: T9SS C-terminal target domain-containing protein [Bacteroidetes bacterium]|nr:MAG: T9SS C-terminal target domain-containing protein [Bacteroidota bacterium]
MRLLYLLSLFCLLSWPVWGQLRITPTEVKREVKLGANDLGYEETFKFVVTNTSTQLLRLRWDREVNFAPYGWETYVCDKEASYPYYVSSNVDPILGINLPVELAPGESFDFYVTIQPFNRTGQCSIRLAFRAVDVPEKVLAAADIRFTVIDSRDSARLRAGNGRPIIFPNPVSDRFFVDNMPEDLARLEIYNTLGRRVRKFEDPMPGDSFGVTDLPQGVYLVSLIDKDGKTLRTLRLLKREFRP